jgi:hypothetical protein
LDVQIFWGFSGITYWYSKLDDHYGVSIDRLDIFDYLFNRISIGTISFCIIVGGRGYNNVVGFLEGILFIKRGAKIQQFIFEIVIDKFILNWLLFAINRSNLFRVVV